MQILLTGSSGLIGSAVMRLLLARATDHLRLLVRQPSNEASAPQVVGDLTALNGCPEVMANVDVVIHCAARVHVMHEASIDPLSAFRAVNVDGTLRLARAAAAAGVRRFVFLSSVKVLGESTLPGQAWLASDRPAPADPYAISKLEAEQGLQALAAETTMELVIIRPPLVYGPGVKANFLSMMRWLERGIPLPLGAIDNRRSLVALDNLVDLVVTCIDHPAASNQVFLVSDGEDLSTTQLLQRMGAALGKPSRLLPVPARWLQVGASLLGKADVAQRLVGSLQVDIESTRRRLDWAPPVTVDQALEQVAKHYLQGKKAWR